MKWAVAVALAGALLTALGARPSGTGPSRTGLPVSVRAAPRTAPAVDTVFRHAAHADVACVRCHSGGAGHGGLLVRTLALPQGATATRALPFRHALHQAVACTSCHGSPPEVRRGGVDCAACHADHHRPTAQCSACHAAAWCSA